MVGKSAVNRDRLVAGGGPIAGGGPGPPGRWGLLGLAVVLLGAGVALAGEQRRGRVQHVLGELPLAGQQPFRQLGPPGITAARQPCETPLRHPPRIGDRGRRYHRPPASDTSPAANTSPRPSLLTRRNPVVLTRLRLLHTIPSIVTIPVTV